jgi:hypothetical protein
LFPRLQLTAARSLTVLILGCFWRHIRHSRAVYDEHEQHLVVAAIEADHALRLKKPAV